MKRFALGILFFALLLVKPDGGKAEAIKKSELDYQNYAFHQWFGTTLVWRFDRLPQNSVVEKHRLPYSGSIYLDHRGGTSAVLRKYDLAFHGGRCRASAFEWQDISERGMPHWAGHCNGWTAAAIRHAEPKENVIQNGVVFTPADIKALLAELYVYADSEFLGGIDPAINPGTLHVVIANWIGLGRHPIGMETAIGEEVWNYPIFGFASNARRRDSRHVEVKMNVGYVDFVEDEVDEAPKRYGRRYFHYVLELNEDGEIVGGSYLEDSDRIDMLWVPLQPATDKSPGNEDGNPYIDPEIVLGMWREATPAAARENWYIADPAQEDAVVENEWFFVDPKPESALPKPAPEQEQQSGISLHALAVAETSSSVDAAATRESPAPGAVRTPVLRELPQASESETTQDNLQSGDQGPPPLDDWAAKPDVATPAEFDRGELEDPGEIPDEGAEKVKEVFREQYANGALKIEREVSLDDNHNYVNDGWYRMWNEEGALVAEGRFADGQRVGPWKHLHWKREGKHFTRPPFERFDEPFLSEAEFHAGELDGKWTFKDAKARLVSQIEFVQGKRHGQHTDWYPNGNKMREVDFCEGQIDGFGRVYNEDGTLYVEEEYVAGRRRSVELETFVSTKKRVEKHVLLPPITMDVSDNWWTGERATFLTEEGKTVQDGPMTAWYENGQERFRGSFLDGQAVGEFQWWRENGQRSQQGSYQEGKQQGDWHWWHPNGSKAAVGRYDRGTPVGRWMWWESDGRLADSKVFLAPQTWVQPKTPLLPPTSLGGAARNGTAPGSVREARR